MMNKKAQQQNYFVVILFIIAFAFTSVMALFIYDEFVSAYTATGYLTNPEAIKATEGFRSSLLVYDHIILLVVVVLLIGIGITSYSLRTHPMFFIVTIIEGALFGAISYFFNYIFIQLMSADVFSTVILSFPKTMILCTNLHWIALACIIIGSITLYAKKQSGEVNYAQ